MADLGKPWAWSITEGESSAPANEAAGLWRKAAYTMTYDCEEPMSCEDVADCIGDSPEVQAALAAAISENEAIRQALAALNGDATFAGAPTFPGVGLTPSQMSAQLNEIDECAFDPFWAQVEQMVDYLITLGTDTLEQIELYSNALEVGGNVPMGNLIGKLKNGTTTGKVMEFLNWVGEVLQEAYVAADTTANRNAIKCAIFCANRDACLITLDGIWNVLNERLGGALNPSSITSLPQLAETMTTITFNPALALDVWLAFLMGTAKTAGLLGVKGIDETIQLMLKVAVNDANNDWETLCEDCPPPTEIIIEVDPNGNFLDGGWSGGTVENLGGGYWRITGVGQQAAVSSVDYVPFIMSDIGGSMAQCNGWKGPGGSFFNGCAVAWAYNGEPVNRLLFAGGGAWAVTFKADPA